METWPAFSLAATVDRATRLLVRLSGAVVAMMTLLAIVDYAYQRFSFLKQMRMTKKELRDEFKQSEGDPVIKSRIRRLRQERAKKRMMAAVPAATVVITNPMHYAVALAYEAETMTAPKVLAKGVDFLARRIREIALENNVPVIENPPLARAPARICRGRRRNPATALPGGRPDHRICHASEAGSPIVSASSPEFGRTANAPDEHLDYSRSPQGPDMMVRINSACRSVPVLLKICFRCLRTVS